MPHIDHARLDTLEPTIRHMFQSAQPYEHVVIDGFLTPSSYQAVLAALPQPNAEQRSSDYVFAKNKFENPIFDQSSPELVELRAELVGERFRRFLEAAYGQPVFVDETFVGGGLHQGGPGSFLDMHADFSRHPVQRHWVREMNILLYLNEGHEESWGGHLEMCNAHTGASGRVAPIGNRLVIMLTKEHTLHGYNPISFPKGVLRTSIASYAYSENANFDEVPDRSTLWRPQGAGISKQLLARIMPTLIGIKRRLLGSSTAKRAERKP